MNKVLLVPPLSSLVPLPKSLHRFPSPLGGFPVVVSPLPGLLLLVSQAFRTQSNLLGSLLSLPRRDQPSISRFVGLLLPVLWQARCLLRPCSGRLPYLQYGDSLLERPVLGSLAGCPGQGTGLVGPQDLLSNPLAG